MANPKRKISRSKRDHRRAHWFADMTASQLTACDHCGEQKVPHRACPSCGYYNGKSVYIPKNV